MTAARSLLEDLPRGTDPVVVLRASTPGDLVLAGEVAELVRVQRRGRLHEVVGPRAALGTDWLAASCRICPSATSMCRARRAS